MCTCASPKFINNNQRLWCTIVENMRSLSQFFQKGASPLLDTVRSTHPSVDAIKHVQFCWWCRHKGTNLEGSEGLNKAMAIRYWLYQTEEIKRKILKHMSPISWSTLAEEESWNKCIHFKAQCRVMQSTLAAEDKLNKSTHFRAQCKLMLILCKEYHTTKNHQMDNLITSAKPKRSHLCHKLFPNRCIFVVQDDEKDNLGISYDYLVFSKYHFRLKKILKKKIYIT